MYLLLLLHIKTVHQTAFEHLVHKRGRRDFFVLPVVPEQTNLL